MSVLMNPFLAGTAGGGVGTWTSIKTVTIDHTKAGASDSSSFPMLFSGTYTYLKTTGNGGNIQNTASSKPCDLWFTSDSGGTTKLDWEIETWDAATGAIVAWVRIPTLSHSSDTVIYLANGNATQTADSSNKTGVWDSNYKVVHHFGDSSTLSLVDSTSNANDGTGFGTPHAGTGKISGGITHIADDAEYERVIHSASGQAAVTISMWVNITSNSSQRGLYSWAGSSSPVSGTPFILIQNNGGTLQWYVDSGYRDTSVSLSTGAWYYLVVTLASSTTWKFYKDGSLLSTYTGGVTFRDSDGQAHFVKSGFSGMSFSIIDEFRVSLTTRGPDWITADYNSQNSPATFYAVT